MNNKEEIKNIKTIIKWKAPDGRTGEYLDDFGFCYYDEYGLNDFWWEEGNGGCDCNRSKMFLKEESWPCGETIEILSITPYEGGN